MAAMSGKGSEIRIIAVGALQNALKLIAAKFSRERGVEANCIFTSPANLGKALLADEFDAIIVAAPAISEFEKSGRLEAASRIKIARVGIGVAYREGRPKPDVSTVATFKNAIKGARNIIYTDPSTPNGSGVVTMRILQVAGLLDVVKAKGRQESLGTGRELIAKGEYEIGLFNLSEITVPGVVVAGPVPDPIQDYTHYEGAVFANSTRKSEASGFLKFAADRSSTPMWNGAGVEAP